MKKDKEWGKEEIKFKRSMRPGYEDYISIKNAMKIMDQLDEPDANPQYSVDDIKDIAVTMNGKVIMPMERLVVGNVTWDAKEEE